VRQLCIADARRLNDRAPAVAGSASAAPWSFTWDPTGLAPGVHVVAARAVAPNSSVDSTLTVVVPTPG
jgi:hypothetical protein